MFDLFNVYKNIHVQVKQGLGETKRETKMLFRTKCPKSALLYSCVESFATLQRLMDCSVGVDLELWL